MRQTVIQADRLGKEYQIGMRADRYRRLSDALVGLAKAPLHRLRRLSGRVDAREKFWALHDLSFEIAEGDAVGIIGRNGAGKSTLLKILSRITEPTVGRVELGGRVGSLLEVGTGFHPELTGRENIYLNGAILGMGRREIRRKFDEIAAFSGVETFLDTPVKRYSSGMYVRLAFAVAAHLEPEILVIDEVLSVGDADFQRKCLGKMGEVAGSGRTVLFVSHNMAAIESLCTSALVLERGRLVYQGDVATAVAEYLHAGVESAWDVDLADHQDRAPGAEAVLRRLRLFDGQGRGTASVVLGDDLCCEIELAFPRRICNVGVQLTVISSLGQAVAKCYTGHQHSEAIDGRGTVMATCRLRECRLSPGSYTLGLSVWQGCTRLDEIHAAAGLEILPSDIYGTGKLPQAHSAIYLPDAEWTINPAADPQTLATRAAE